MHNQRRPPPLGAGRGEQACSSHSCLRAGLEGGAGSKEGDMLNVQLLLDADVPKGRCVKYTLAILASAETGLLPCLPDLTTKGCERIGDVLEAVGGVLATEPWSAGAWPVDWHRIGFQGGTLPT